MVFPFTLRLAASRARTPGSRLVPAKHVVSTVHGSRTVLLDARSGHYYGLDEVGSRIWSLANEGYSVDSIAQTLSEEYDAAVEALSADVSAFVEELRKSRLLEDA